MANDVELKPCPFCGGKAELREMKNEIPFSCGYRNIFFVICQYCGCSPFPRAGENIYCKKDGQEIKRRLIQEAVDAWNQRAKV